MKKNNFTNNRDDRWYLNIMSPNTKGGKFAWLDPTSIYINTEAFHDLLDDLLLDLKGYDCDVVTDKVEFINYSKRNQEMEIRFPAFEKGTKVFIVDQWVETGGTMNAAIQLVERQGGIVNGVISLAIEENNKTQNLRNNYNCFSAVVPESQWQKQCNKQHLNSFKNYKPNMAFPNK